MQDTMELKMYGNKDILNNSLHSYINYLKLLMSWFASTKYLNLN